MIAFMVIINYECCHFYKTGFAMLRYNEIIYVAR